MDTPYKAVKISEHVWWVGAIDWSIRDFHGYLTSRGTTYNAYLVMADKVTLIDTVKKPFRDELLARIRSVVQPGKIDYIVSNHAEMDHTGCLPEMLEIVKPEKVFASVQGKKAIDSHFHIGDAITAVKTGDSISLGNMNLAFIETKMLHWPDSMISYLDADKVVFSQDAFGMHLASSERFVDELSEPIIDHEMAKYYANILLPMSPLVAKFLGALPGYNLDINTIASDHGPIWRSDLSKPLDLYAKWAEQKPANKAVVVYDTMWGSTGLMAQAVGEGLASAGSRVNVMKLRAAHRSDVMTELLDAGALVVGSPTINNNIFPTVSDMLVYAKGLAPKNLIGAAFGSYGWSGQAVKHINEILANMKVELVHDGMRAIYVPGDNALVECRKLGETVAAKLAEICG